MFQIIILSVRLVLFCNAVIVNKNHEKIKTKVVLFHLSILSDFFTLSVALSTKAIHSLLVLVFMGFVDNWKNTTETNRTCSCPRLFLTIFSP